ncbi:hypothetical protein JMJ77_0006305 [Colletotrichum scovillei]|uniref:Uncharacterized protein n=1 Tax=Colletotrichum scovillei TaxID=1209932 RepID=A0A9P7RIF0_9PEZI|nr:hypothetical protein JMJ77_0006305 [Colletotrichum scovillei]KAG7077586.1 hypothetical protein JMJ76_0014832 [Colletotrichum scovillei]KAG7084748.1 hypothetical protein JMJ78_0010180 [Colletotrichum scovillei]
MHDPTKKFSITQSTPTISLSLASPFNLTIKTMEQFGLSAAHSGAINHIHAIHFGPAAVDVVREIRIAVTVVVIGWVAVTGIRTVFARDRR